MPEKVIDEALSRELENYKGRWVAIDEAKNKVVGHGDSLEKARQEALDRGVTEPLLYRVPAHPERIAFL